jgi:predicted small metal-binding protein
MNTQSANEDANDNRETNHRRLSFRCLDLGIEACPWQASANTEAELLSSIENHLHDRHDFSFDDATRIMVRNAIQRRAA